MSNPPSPLASLTAEIHRWAAVLARTARNVADGEISLAAATLEVAEHRLEDIRLELLELEPHELPLRLLQPDDAPPGDPAKEPTRRGSPLQSHLGRRQGASVDATPDTGFADEPLF